MREIKFRAWDKRGKSFVYFTVKLGKEVFLAPDEYSEELCLFTGLLDKNGKEIYEGDIVRRGGEFVPEGEWGIVEFAGCSFGLNRESFIKEHQVAQWIDSPEQYFDNEGKTEWCEVIGNIYENPELIKEQQ